MTRYLYGLLLSLLPLVAQAATLTFSPARSDIFVGDTITTNLNADDLADVLGFTVTFAYDGQVAKPVAALPGELITLAPCPYFWFAFPPTDGDTLRVDAAALGCRWAGAGTLAQFRFVGLRDGITEFHYLYGQMRNGQNQPIPIAWGTALLQVRERVIPARPMTWTRLKQLYR